MIQDKTIDEALIELMRCQRALEGGTMNGPVHYRIHDEWSEHGAVALSIEKFHVLRETPAGYWLLTEYRHSYLDTFPGWADEFKRWAPKQGSRYCQSTMAEALRSFSIRKHAQLKHLRSQLSKCEHVLAAWGAISPTELTTEGYQELGFPGDQFELTLLPPSAVNV